MEDNRFLEVGTIPSKAVSPRLEWFFNEDYFSEELLGISQDELAKFREVSQQAFSIFEKATDKIIRDRKLSELGIPEIMHSIIESTWNERNENPLLVGRFDINGGLDGLPLRVIEFNADTCSTIPETIFWQKAQLQQLSGKQQFNQLENGLEEVFLKLKRSIPYALPNILGSTFGFPEDVENCKTILDIAHKAGFKTYYADLEKVVFSEEGIFVDVFGEYEMMDIWFKIIPWDWMFTEEPELASQLVYIIKNKLCKVLNPPYTSIWQNKKFLAYITRNFPNNVIAETYTDKNSVFDPVIKPIYGRLGENIEIPSLHQKTNGDFKDQDKVYQKFYFLPKDKEGYFYQIGTFVTGENVVALNVRTQDNLIISDECEFMSHYLTH